MRTPRIWLFLLPSAVLGFANAGIWAPLSSTVTRNLPPRQAGAGSGVYNTTRQIGAVLGSAAIATGEGHGCGWPVAIRAKANKTSTWAAVV